MEKRLIICNELANRKERGTYFVGLFQCCQSAYCTARQISATTLKRYRQHVKYRLQFDPYSAIESVPHGRRVKVYLTKKTEVAISFVRWWAEQCGERSPDTGKIHCFMFLNPEQLYIDFCEYCNVEKVPEGSQLSRRSFLGLVRGESPHSRFLNDIVWRRHVTQKGCSICEGFRTEALSMMRNGTGKESPEWVAWSKRRQLHLKVLWSERKAYVALVAQAVAGSREVCIFDEAHPVRHPRKLTDTQVGREVLQMSSPLIGFLFHTTQHGYFFTTPGGGVEKDGTFTWEVADVPATLLFEILRLKRLHNCLRKHLHIQLDGGSTCRSFLLVFLLGLLVGLKWWKG